VSGNESGEGTVLTWKDESTGTGASCKKFNQNDSLREQKAYSQKAIPFARPLFLMNHWGSQII
jgi:hypothetical protein